MGLSAAAVAWKMSFQLSPIIFTGGIAGPLPGGLPIILITEALDFIGGVLSGGGDINLDRFFANFWPLPGSKLANNDYANVPFANQVIAANARIKQPPTISLRMICPAQGEAGYARKLATMTALASIIDQHAALGGAYTVATPAKFYPNCLLLDLVDTSAGDSRQPQNAYQWNFYQPLLTLTDAQQVQNNLMSQISGGLSVGNNPAWSGLAPTIGNSGSLGAIGTLPAASQGAGNQVVSSGGNASIGGITP